MLISFFDAKLNFGESQAFGNAGTVASANVLQMDKADPGRMAVDFHVTAAAVGGRGCSPCGADGRWTAGD